MISQFRLFIIAFILLSETVTAQDTVFDLLKSDNKLGDSYFDNGNYIDALELYSNKDASPANSIKIARCYYFLKRYGEAAKTYDKVKDEKYFTINDLFYYAEAYSSAKKYDKAIELYKKLLEKVPHGALIMKKIWQLNNIQYLYEDSLHYTLSPIPINTEGYSEFSAFPIPSGIIFLSNRKSLQIFEKMDGSLNMPFYKLFFSQISTDTNGIERFNDPQLLSEGLSTKYHSGPAAVYSNSSRMVFSTTGLNSNDKGAKTLQLHFAERQGSKWKVFGSYPFNSNKYSITDPSINEEGTVLYFTSDMKDGIGGKDIYRSEFQNGEWTMPVNLGEPVNTPYDEVFPYLHLGKTLYFSSNGHAGLGGLDVFKCEISNGSYGEIQNVGYPLNSSYDDFGLTIDPLSTHGYLTSNRLKGGFYDDIYSFEMDIQKYPLQISGIIKYIENNWTDSSALMILPDVKLYFIDNVKDVVVTEADADNFGNFSVTIPYFSIYKIRIEGKDINGLVSFEVPKYRKLKGNYEIVLVKDEFDSTENPDLK